MIDFQTHPDRYQHWKLSFENNVAYLTMDVDENAGLKPGYVLKMNSYDLGVDIELYDAVQRLRFEHPEVGCVVLRSEKPNIFCAGANIRMLGLSTHVHKVNFCKFTNETRNSIEDATENSRQRYICAVNGTAAGGGYELALATDYILLIDDGRAAVSLPEVPLLAVLPGTGGLTRIVDKRKVRRDLADIFSSTEEGARGQTAVDWRLADELVKSSSFAETVAQRASSFSNETDRPKQGPGILLTPLNREIDENLISYDNLTVELDRAQRLATLTLKGPVRDAPLDLAGLFERGDSFWLLQLARELDDALLHLRANEAKLGTLIFKTDGDIYQIAGYESLLAAHSDNWLVREIILYWKRTLKRVDLTSRSLIALAGPGSCFSGILAELLFAADRSYLLEGEYEGDDRPAPLIRLSSFNFGPMKMSNGLTRLETRFYGESDSVQAAQLKIDQDIDALSAYRMGLVTYALDDIDWDEEIRLMLEERVSFSPDALTGMEANLRFVGPETMETKIFGRLTAWQNWIFQRPNAVAEDGALRLYGTGIKPEYNFERV